mgnify:FL=1
MGKTGLQLSTLSFGSWVTFHKQIDDKIADELMGIAYEQGVNFFDNAEVYAAGESEKMMGRVLSKKNWDRTSIVLSSKAYFGWRGKANKPNQTGLSRKHLTEACHEALQRLQTDYLDLLLLHRPSPLMEVHEIAEVLNALKKEGKIKAIGVSNFTSSQLILLQQALPIAWNQLECSLTHSEPIFDGTLDAMRSSGVQAMAWGALGNYFKKKTPAQQRIATLMTVLCDQYQCSEAQLLIAWLLKHPAPIHPVVGTTNPNRMQAFIDAVNSPLDIQDWFLLLEASLGQPVP